MNLAENSTIASEKDFLVQLNEKLVSITFLITSITNYFGIGTEIIFFGFLIHQFIRKRKTSKMCSAFFYLLAIGYFVDLLFLLIWTSESYLPLNKAEIGISGLLLVYVNSITQWHALIFLGPWNFMLALNRFSSLIFINNYEKYWSKYFFFAVGILLLYPFFANGYSFLDIYCRFHLKYPECINFFKQTFSFSAISNGIFAILSLFIGIATYFMYRRKIKFSNLTIKDKTEQKLLFQSLFVSIFFGIYCALTGYSSIPKINNNATPEGKLISTTVNFLFAMSKFFHHYFSILLLFIFSKTVQREFCETFHLYYFWKPKSNISKFNTESKIPKTVAVT